MALGTTTVNFETGGVDKLFADAADRVRTAILQMNGAAIAAAEAMLKMQKQHNIDTVRIEAQDLEKGDVIIEFQSGKRPNKYPLDEAPEHSACASRGTHVKVGDNKTWCYPARAMVWVLA